MQHWEACDQGRALPALGLGKRRVPGRGRGGEIKQEGAVGSALVPLVFTLASNASVKRRGRFGKGKGGDPTTWMIK